jgi:hypothetical protein
MPDESLRGENMKIAMLAAAAAVMLGGCVAVPADPYYAGPAYYYPPTVSVGVHYGASYHRHRGGHYGHRHHYRHWR